jgi:type III restriction enzyme
MKRMTFKILFVAKQSRSTKTGEIPVLLRVTVNGQRCETSIILFMHQKSDSSGFDNMQIFIEPKGGHLKEHDVWKENFLLRMKAESRITFSTQTTDFKIWGMPFFTYQDKQIFDKAMREEFGLESGL